MKQKKDKVEHGGFFLQAIGFFPVLFFAAILFFARGSMMDMINNWGVEKPTGAGEPLLEKHLFVQDQYHRRNIEKPDEVFELSNGVYAVQHFSGSDMDVTEIEFTLSNGDIYKHTQLPHSKYLEGFNKYKMIVHYEVKNGWVTYLDPETDEWVINKRLRSGVSFPMNMAFVNIDNEKYLVFDYPYSYKKGEDGNVIACDEEMGKIYVNPRGYGFDFVVGYPMKEDVYTEMWTLESQEPLVDMENPEAIFQTGETSQEFWRRCQYGTNHRFLIDGYYSKTPATYSGHTANAFWLNPAVHIPYNYIVYGEDRAADDLGYIQLYMSSRSMTPEGYYKTAPESKWLKENYGIDKGFYDTRFNADMGVALIKAHQKYDEPYFLGQAKALLSFYKDFAQKNHYTFYNERSEQGWLVQDYWHENGAYTPVHSSLNHQLQEMYFLYLMGAELDDFEAIQIADKLLKGIETTTDIWMKPDGDLYYGYTPDGAFDKDDYPDLTYNDMYNVQNILVDMGRSRNESLDKLMKSKKAFMDARGITSYLQ